MMEQIIDMHNIAFDKKKHVRIDRASIWGNPFTLENPNNEEDRVEVLWKYTLYLLRNQKLLNSLHTLEGKTLACWCYPKRKCHGQILVYLINHPDIIATCKSPGANRETLAEKIFEGLRWEHKKRYVQATLI